MLWSGQYEAMVRVRARWSMGLCGGVGQEQSGDFLASNIAWFRSDEAFLNGCFDFQCCYVWFGVTFLIGPYS